VSEEDQISFWDVIGVVMGVLALTGIGHVVRVYDAVAKAFRKVRNKMTEEKKVVEVKEVEVKAEKVYETAVRFAKDAAFLLEELKRRND